MVVFSLVVDIWFKKGFKPIFNYNSTNAVFGYEIKLFDNIYD